MSRFALFVMLGMSVVAPMPTVGADLVRAAKPTFKGVELYSWKDNADNWRYSLLPGTNRLKTKSEIVSERVTIKDIATLKQRLAALAVGEHVFWFNADASGFSFPDPTVVADLVAYARMVQVTVQVPE